MFSEVEVVDRRVGFEKEGKIRAEERLQTMYWD